MYLANFVFTDSLQKHRIKIRSYLGAEDDQQIIEDLQISDDIKVSLTKLKNLSFVLSGRARIGITASLSFIGGCSLYFLGLAT